MRRIGEVAWGGYILPVVLVALLCVIQCSASSSRFTDRSTLSVAAWNALAPSQPQLDRLLGIDDYAGSTTSSASTPTSAAIDPLQTQTDTTTDYTETRDNNLDSWLPEMSDFGYRQCVSIQGSSAGTQATAVLPLTLHYGTRTGPPEPGHVWLAGNCNPDFSDIRIYDDSGTEVPFTVAVQGNFDIVPDRRLGHDNLIVPADFPSIGLYTGDIISSKPNGEFTVGVSHDNGKTWEYRAGIDYSLRHLTANGVLIGNLKDGIYRSLDGGYNWQMIYDLSQAGDYSGLLYQGITEDDLGNVYLGIYLDGKDANGQPNHATVIKITADHIKAPVWDDSYATVCFKAGVTTPPEDTNWQIHAIQADPYNPGHIYAIGADPFPAIYQSVDYGETWTTLKGGTVNIDHRCDTLSMSFTQDYIYFSGEGSMWCPPSSIYRWNRADEWVRLFPRGAPLGNLFHLGQNWYACSLTRSPDFIPRIWISPDIDDDLWSVVGTGRLQTDGMDASKDGNFIGWYYSSGVGTPTGDDQQCIVAGGNANAAGDYPTLRFYDGSDHHYALLYAKVSNVPASGANLHVYYGCASAGSVSSQLGDIMTDAQADDSLVAHWTLDNYTDWDTELTSDVGSWTGTVTGSPGSMPVSIDSEASAVGPLLVPSRAGRYIMKGPASKYFKLNNVPGDALDLDQNFTILAWVKIDTFYGDQDFNFLLAKGWNETMQWGLYISRPSIKYGRGILGFGNHTAGVTVEANLTDGPAVGDDNWQQVGIIIGTRTGTYPETSSQTCRFIVNGVVGDEQKLTGPGIKKMTPADGNNYLNVAIGALANPSATYYSFAGSFDDIRVYNTELTPAQVQAIYEQRPIAVPEVQLGNPVPSPPIITDQISPPSAAMTSTGPVTYTVTYVGASSVTLTEADVHLNKTGTADGTVTVSGSGTTSRTVTISSIAGSGTLGISIAAGTAQSNNYSAPTAGPSATFQVDGTPPEVVDCHADAYTASTANLSVHWLATDAESGIAGYEYAVGTEPLGTDVTDWTSAGTVTDYTITGLSLVPGGRYFVSVRAVNSVGLTSDPASTAAVTAACTVASVSEAKAQEDGTAVALPVDTVVSAKFNDCFYIEDSNRAAGIRVDCGSHLQEGQKVTVFGVLGLSADGERVILSPVIEPGHDGTIIQPLGMACKYLGGADLGFTPGITGGVGLNNIGLLVRIAGTITVGLDDGFFLDDGSNLTDETNIVGIRVWTGQSGTPFEQMTTTVTGVVSCRRVGNVVYPMILASQVFAMQ